MRRWFGPSLLLLCAGAAQAAPRSGGGRPIASHFDLSRSLITRVAFDATPRAASPTRHWNLQEIATPPGPPRDPPRLRVRGKQVKFRIPL